jgi:hypothetical protein
MVKEVLIGDDTITIRHSLPVPSVPPQNGGPPPPGRSQNQSGGQSYLLRKGSGEPCTRQPFPALFDGCVAATTFSERTVLPLKSLWQHVNSYLVRWMQRKYKRLARGVIRAARALGRLAERAPRSFVHWERGFSPAAR